MTASNGLSTYPMFDKFYNSLLVIWKKKKTFFVGRKLLEPYPDSTLCGRRGRRDQQLTEQKIRENEEDNTLIVLYTSVHKYNFNKKYYSDKF